MAKLTIAVDGPASSGKGTLARGIAKSLDYEYVDTGAIYRSVALFADRAGIPWSDEGPLAALAGSLRFTFQWKEGRLLVQVNGEDVTDAIRRDEISRGASAVSKHGQVRRALLELQRDLGARGGVVMDGRDIGTVVLPTADVKLFLEADLDERARRRHLELVKKGQDLTYEDVRSAIAARDRQDSERAHAPLRAAEDAIVLDSTHLSAGEALESALKIIAEHLV